MDESLLNLLSKNITFYAVKFIITGLRPRVSHRLTIIISRKPNGQELRRYVQ